MTVIVLAKHVGELRDTARRYGFGTEVLGRIDEILDQERQGR